MRIACGTQRGGANSDALAKFQFRDVGLLVILIGNVHHFPFFLLISMQTTLVCFFVPSPKSLRYWCVLYRPSSCFIPMHKGWGVSEFGVRMHCEWRMDSCDAKGMKLAILKHNLGNVHWPEASSHEVWAETNFPSFLIAWWGNLLGFQRSGKAGVLQL